MAQIRFQTSRPAELFVLSLRFFACCLAFLVCFGLDAWAQQGAYLKRLDGAGAGDRFGESVAVMTDSVRDQDGWPDLLVGAPDNDYGGGDAGAIYAYSLLGVGQDTDPALETDFIYGSAGWKYGGVCLASGIDFDHDSWDEIMYVHYISYGYWVGAVLSGDVACGNQHCKIREYDRYHRQFFPVGDFDADGTRDLGVFYWNGGKAIIYSGADLNTQLLNVGGGNEQFGYQIAPAGDLDGDGKDDVVATAPYADYYAIVDAGSLTAFAQGGTASTPRVLWTFYGEKSGDRLEAVCNMGDLTGDGLDDFAVGSPGVDVGGTGGLVDAGRVYLVSGADGSELDRLDGFAPGLGFGGGRRLSAGDLNNDGRSELIVGLPGYDPGSKTDAGAIRIYEWRSGSGFSLLFGADGDEAWDKFGASVIFTNDLTGDGQADFAATSPYADPAGLANAGSVFVFSGFADMTPHIEAPPSTPRGQNFSVDLTNARPGEQFLLLGSPSIDGSSLFGLHLDIGPEPVVTGVGGIVPLTGRLRVQANWGGSPLRMESRIYLQGILFDDRQVPWEAARLTNWVPVDLW